MAAFGFLASALGFRKQVALMTVRLEQRTEKTTEKKARSIRFQIALATPFDTGRAAAGWNASIGGPNSREPGTEVSFSSIVSAARAGEVNLEGLQLGDEIHISNSVPYIRRLNAGHSAQAPRNFVEMTVQRLTV